LLHNDIIDRRERINGRGVQLTHLSVTMTHNKEHFCASNLLRMRTSFIKKKNNAASIFSFHLPGIRSIHHHHGQFGSSNSSPTSSGYELECYGWQIELGHGRGHDIWGGP